MIDDDAQLSAKNFQTQPSRQQKELRRRGGGKDFRVGAVRYSKGSSLYVVCRTHRKWPLRDVKFTLQLIINLIL